MPEITVSPKFSWKGALNTTLRHTVVPIVAGSVSAAVDTIRMGAVDPTAMIGAAKIAALAGVVRWLHFFCTKQEVTQ